jgi:hypothetical protein
MDAYSWIGEDNRDVLDMDVCGECESSPCLCAAIEAGERCARCRQPVELGPYGDYARCGDCFGGGTE